MEEQEQKLYIKGFNGGYLLAKNDPALAAQLTATENSHIPFFEGMTAGKEQYEHEVREWSKGFSRNAPEKDDREKSHER